MANPTSNFGWQMPTNTDLVKDLPADFEVFGQAVDTSLMDLKGGTTGQVLSKASNTDMDFTWVAQDDSNAIQNALLTTTGDTIYASGASTPARLGIGSTGQVLTVAGGIPSWATPASGGITLISTTTLTGATISLTSIPQTYRHLQVIVRLWLPATTNVGLRLRLNSDSTANRHRQNYAYGSLDFSYDSTNVLITGNARNSASSTFVVANIYDYTNTTTPKMGDHLSVNTETTANFTFNRGHWVYSQTGAITSLDFINTSGNFTSGDVLLYGVK